MGIPTLSLWNEKNELQGLYFRKDYTEAFSQPCFLLYFTLPHFALQEKQKKLSL
jgi:hypothetical protein